MNNLTTKVLVALVILVSWAKAGLAGDWILNTINLVVFALLITLFKAKEKIRFRLLSILPILILCAQFLLSYSNPLFSVIKESGWAKLNISIAKGKKIYDKREDLKTKDIKREIDRSLKNFK